ncbi:MAG TPA: aldo/keto reductase, partial [Ilumatobacteraceae bacterium]|nr:aldo/keto reductase [Ilumatobacteraceae bacterium]
MTTPTHSPAARTATLGHSGIEVSRIALGTMMFGSWGNDDEAECHEMTAIALDRGITFFDTADMYDQGRSEEILGRALAGRRSEIVLATKVFNQMGDDPSHCGLSPRWIKQACDDSLRRLGTDYIDLYQMHRPDPDVPIAESLGAMRELVDAGKVRAIGTSVFSAAQLTEAATAGLADDSVRITSEQPPYSILVRAIEADVLPACAANDIGVVVWAPLNGGWLTGKYNTGNAGTESRAARKGDHFDHKDAEMRERKLAMVDQLMTIAADAGLTITELAMGFVLSNPAITSLLVGPRTPAQLRDLLDAQHVTLSPDILA